MLKTKKLFFAITLLSVSALLLFMSCDPLMTHCRLSFHKSEISFTKEGGEERVAVSNVGGGKWEKKCAPLSWPLDMAIHTERYPLPDGSMDIEIKRDTIGDRIIAHINWVEIEYALYPPRKEILVKAKPNSSGESRIIYYTVAGAEIADLKISQD